MILARLLSWFGLHADLPPPDDSAVQQAFRDVQAASLRHERVTSREKTAALNRIEIASHDRRPEQMVEAADRLRHLSATMLDRLR